MIYIESHEETERRIDAMLQEMVVEEGLSAFEAGRDPRSHTLQEIADFSGVGFETMRRIEKTALSNLKKIMLELEIIKNGNSGI